MSALTGVTSKIGQWTDFVITFYCFEVFKAFVMLNNCGTVTLQQRVLTATTAFLHLIGIAAVLYQEPNYWKQGYHTSALSGKAWVNELIHEYPDQIFCELGMQLHVFMAL